MNRFPMALALTGAFAASLLAATLPAVASSESVVYSFKGGSDGFFAESGLVQGPTKALYGVTPYGGAAGHGALYEVTPPATAGGAWTEKVLYSFKGGTTDGAVPMGRLLVDAVRGTLYGTTNGGGAHGCGTVFKLVPPATAGGAWTRVVLYSFKGGTDGAGPIAGLTQGKGGVLYGTTYTAGTGLKGTVFALTPPSVAVPRWTEKVLASFKGGTDASVPNGAVVVDAAGNLYGTTLGGGAKGQGTVYRVAPPVAPATAWKTDILYSFQSGSDGGQPQAELVFDTAGALYGTTVFGGGVTGGTGAGTVFRLAPPKTVGGAWTEAVIYRFKGGADGGGPQGGLMRGFTGALFGTTAGTVFKLSPGATGWTETVLHKFGPAPDGSTSWATPIRGADGALYGTTFGGGANNLGAVFRVVP